MAAVSSATTSYSASKTAANYYTYAVVRASQGMYLRYAKDVHIASLQSDNSYTGLTLNKCKAVSIGTLYSEWRGVSLTTPNPRGDGLLVNACSGVSVLAAYGDMRNSVVNVQGSFAVGVRSAMGSRCQRSIVHYQTVSGDQAIELGELVVGGTTPQPLTTGSTTDAHYYGPNINSPSPTTVHRFEVDHNTNAEFVSNWRHTRNAALGADSTSGYVWVASATLPSPSSTYANQVRAQLGKYYVCDNHTSAGTYQWIPIGSSKPLATPTYGASISPDATNAWNTISVTNGTAFTISGASNSPGSSSTGELVIEIYNNSGGAMGTITWSGTYVFTNGAFTNPASTKKRFVKFQYNGSAWIEVSRAAADY